MLVFLLETLIFSFCVGVIAMVYYHVLAYSPLLNWWFRFGAKFENRWFHGPIWGCECCISGQLALWSYLGTVIIPACVQERGQGGAIETTAVYFTASPASVLFGLILAICGAITTAIVLRPLFHKNKNG